MASALARDHSTLSGSSSSKPQNVMGETDDIDDLLNGVAGVLLEVVTGVAGVAGCLPGVAGVACFLAGVLSGDGFKNAVMGFWQAEDSMFLSFLVGHKTFIHNSLKIDAPLQYGVLVSEDGCQVFCFFQVS